MLTVAFRLYQERGSSQLSEGIKQSLKLQWIPQYLTQKLVHTLSAIKQKMETLLLLLLLLPLTLKKAFSPNHAK